MKYAKSHSPLDFFGLYRPGYDTLVRSCGGMRDELEEFASAYHPEGNMLAFEELAICMLRGPIQTDCTLSPVRLDDDDAILFVGVCLMGVRQGNESDMMDLYLFVRNAWRGLRKRQVDRWLPLALDPSPLDIFILHHPKAMEVLSKLPGGARETLVTATTMRKPGHIWAFALAGGILRGGPRRLVTSTLSPVHWCAKYLSLVMDVDRGDLDALDRLANALFTHYVVASNRWHFVSQIESLDLDVWGEGEVPVRAMFPPYSFEGIKTFNKWAPNLLTLLADAEENGLVPSPVYVEDLPMETREDLANTADMRKELAREKRWAQKASPLHIKWCRTFFRRVLLSVPTSHMSNALFHLVPAVNYWSRLPFLQYDRVPLKWVALDAWVQRNQGVDVTWAVAEYEKEERKLDGKSVAIMRGFGLDPLLKVLSHGGDSSILNPRQLAINEIGKVPKEIVAKFDERQFLGRQKKPVKSDSRKASYSSRTGGKRSGSGSGA